MVYCSAPTCRNSSSRNRDKVRFFIFPKDKSRRVAWARIVKPEIDWEPPYHAQLCQAHFEPSQFREKIVEHEKITLKKDALPSIFEPHPPKNNKRKNTPRDDHSYHSKNDEIVETIPSSSEYTIPESHEEAVLVQEINQQGL